MGPPLCLEDDSEPPSEQRSELRWYGRGSLLLMVLLWLERLLELM